MSTPPPAERRETGRERTATDRSSLSSPAGVRRASAGTVVVTEPGAATEPLTRPDNGPPAAGAQPLHQPGSGLGLFVSIAVAAVVFLLAIYATGSRPTNTRLPLLQTTTPLFWAGAVLAIVGAAVGAEFSERSAARNAIGGQRRGLERSIPTAWIVPAVATFAAVLLIATYHNAPMMVVGPLTAFLGSAGALLARDLLDDAADSAERSATTIHTLVVHAVAFLALSAVYLNKMATPISALLVAAVGGLLTLESLDLTREEPERRVTYALLAALVMAQATVALMWWQTHGWTGGAVLLVCYYLSTGILLARTRRSEIRSRDLVEFGAVGFVALAILAVTA